MSVSTSPRFGSEQAPAIVGRSRELSALRDCLAATFAGHGRLVLIGGEAGIGKTALAKSVARDAQAQDALVLAGHCYDLTETPPYGPWTRILAQDPFTPDRSRRLLVDSATDTSADQLSLFSQLRDDFVALAHQQPLVLLLEDMHWADSSSIELLRFLSRGLSDVPILLAVTYRADEVNRRHALFPVLPLLVREAEALRIDLRPLESDDVRSLVATRYQLPDVDLARLLSYLEQNAEGNPLYVTELTRALEEERLLRPANDRWELGDLAHVPVPPLLRQVIEARLVRLGEEAHELLAVAAVIGQQVPISLWHAVADAAEDTLFDVIEGAVEARLVETSTDGARVSFAHALVRETLYDSLLAPRRRAWHRRVGEALLTTRDPDPDEVADHLQRAGDPRAVEWLLRAAERAQHAYAFLTAAERFDAALQLLEAQGAPEGERAGLLYRLARMRRYADPRHALAYLDDGVRLAETADDRILAAYIGTFRGSLRCTTGDIRRGLAELEAGIAAIDLLSATDLKKLRTLQERLGDPPDEHYYRGALVNWLALAGRCAEALAVGESLVALTESNDSGNTLNVGRISRQLRQANIWRGLASSYAVLGRPDEARRAYAESCAAYQSVDHHYQIGNALLLELYEVVMPYQADDLAERRRLAGEAEAAWTRATGALDNLPPRFAWMPILIIEGNWAEARRLALAASAPGGRTGWRPLATSLLAFFARSQGDTELAWQLVHKQLPSGHAAQPGDAIYLDTLVLQRLAVALALDGGDFAAARSWLEAHDRWLSWSSAVLGQAEAHLGWSAYHRAVDETAQARRRAEQALASATEPRQPLVLLAAHRLLGELDTSAKHYQDADGHFESALALAADCAAPYERALTLLAKAEFSWAKGQIDAARSIIEEARAITSPLGATPLLTTIDALSARITARPSALQYPAGLTAREVEVLRLVSDGLTDGQVAERLFLSRRTVSQHLRSVYNKLGVSSRAAATRFGVENELW